jgi:hypothetical protein
LEQIDRLANIEAADVFAMEAAKEKALQRYGPTEEKGFVHIPITRAIEAVAGKLPVTKTPQPHPRETGGLLDWGASNSGRFDREEPR